MYGKFACPSPRNTCQYIGHVLIWMISVLIWNHKFPCHSSTKIECGWLEIQFGLWKRNFQQYSKHLIFLHFSCWHAGWHAYIYIIYMYYILYIYYIHVIICWYIHMQMMITSNSNVTRNTSLYVYAYILYYFHILWTIKHPIVVVIFKDIAMTTSKTWHPLFL